MPRNCQRSECAEVATVLEGDKTEWDDDEENGFLVHMPAEEERCIAAEGDRTDKSIPTAWLEPDLDERNLDDCQRRPKTQNEEHIPLGTRMSI